MTISLCMIVKNEEKNLDNCLSSVYDLFDEINIVDTGSSDKTIEIAQKYTDRIFHFDWINDFSAARNFSFSKATMDYIMWLDADDVMMPDDRQKFKNLAANMEGKNIDAVIMDYKYEKDDLGNVLVTQKRERLVKRSKGYVWKNKLHETLNVDTSHDNVYVSDIAIDHEYRFSRDDKAWVKRNLEVLEGVIGTDEETPRDLAHYGLTLYSDNQTDKALIYLEKYMENSKNDEFAQSGDIAIFRALHKIYIEKKDYEKAYLILEENADKLRHLSEYHCFLGDFACDILKDYESAIYYYKRALNCKDTSSDGMITYETYYYFIPFSSLGKAYIQLKKYGEAIKCYERAGEYVANGSVEKEKVEQVIERLRRLR